MQSSFPKNVTILGATGSVGVQTLDVISRHPEYFSVFALSAENNAHLLLQQCQKFNPRFAVISENHYTKLKRLFDENKITTTLLSGENALSDIACAEAVDQVVAAIVGGAGLRSIHAAVRSGKDILLANKESLVMTGSLLLETAKQTGANILPLDSEHNALFQCLPSAQGFREKTLTEAGISKLLLTASGGPFRQTPIHELAKKTATEACHHPKWKMGEKISVDSATMMNKGLEYIEAKLLFVARNDELDVIIHPQSIIHSLVQYQDGTSLAQIGHSDMRVPIAHALSYPQRIKSGVNDIDLTQYTLTFEPVDFNRYPCLALAIKVANDNVKTTIMNAANEVAVNAFLTDAIGFMQIYETIEQCISLEFSEVNTINSVDEVLHLDYLTRLAAEKIINQ